VKFFGRRPAVCDDDQRIAAPTCAPCAHCGEAIGKQDDGFAIPSYDGGDILIMAPFHRACFLRGIVGSVAHQRRECSCFGGLGEDDPKLTRREAAQAALDLWEHR